MSGLYLLIATFIIIAIVLITIVLVLFQKYKIKTIREQLELLDKEKNLIASTPVMSELAKVEPIIKNDKMYLSWSVWNASNPQSAVVWIDYDFTKDEIKDYIVIPEK